MVNAHLRLALIASLLGLACGRSAGGPQDKTDGVSVELSQESLRCVSRAADSTCALFNVSMYELVANAAAYHGKLVQVVGFAHFEFEGDALYAHRSDWEQAIARNGLWIEVPDTPTAPLQDRYLLVEGTFDARERGHFGLWSGSIRKVKRIEIWARPKMPPAESIPTIDLTLPPSF